MHGATSAWLNQILGGISSSKTLPGSMLECVLGIIKKEIRYPPNAISVGAYVETFVDEDMSTHKCT